MQYNKLCITIVALWTIATVCFAQEKESVTITGIVLDVSQNPVPFANVIIEKLALGTTANENGNFILEKVPSGRHILKVSVLGYTSQTKTITVNKNTNPSIRFLLKEESSELDEVVVSGKSQNSKVKEQPYSVIAIDVKPLKALNLDVNQILNTTTGVRIREDGGLGSNFNFSLNGFSGNQVKFFLDGIPMENFGSSLTLNNIPANQISRLEVYKGVVPIHLGADALGGAVNVITNTSAKSFLDVSYSLGSFNTHRVSLQGKYFSSRSGFTLNTNAFFNYSDNNYKIDIALPEEGTGIIDEDNLTEVERFHDSYQSQTIQVEGGFVNKRYADRIFIGVTGSSNRKDIQHGFTQRQPFGDVFREDKVIVGSFRYQKDTLFVENLGANIFATYSHNERLLNDTSDFIYDWLGEATPNPTPAYGEREDYKTEFTFTDKSFNSGVGLIYDLSDKHSFSLNNTYSRVSRSGDDPLSPDGVVPFKTPNHYTKNITGLAYNLSLLNGSWKTNFFGKNFLMKADTYNEDWSQDEGHHLDHIVSDYSFVGYGIASTYFVFDALQVKGSYENTYRLPTVLEIFGDGVNHLSNVEIQPEKSKNLNIGVLVNKQFNKHNLQIEAGYLYRKTENLIRDRILFIYRQSVNLFKAKTNSVEGELKYNYNDRFYFVVNAAYQDIINTNELSDDGTANPVYLDRIPNIPYLFGNASFMYRHQDFLKDDNHLSINFSTHFVEEFFLNWPSQGREEDKFVIPQQISFDLSVSHAWQSGKYSASAGVTNLLGDTLYDNFRLQKPGRAFSIKLNYFIR